MEKLTDCEELVMKTVWDADEELSLMEIMQRVNDKYHKEWKPQTVSTFLARLVSKGYLRHYRQGRVFFYQILVPLEDYKSRLTEDFINFWHKESTGSTISEQITTLREIGEDPEGCCYPQEYLQEVINEAANTIEFLCVKLQVRT